MTVAEIRQHFFDYFQSKQHRIVPSASMVVKDDPTLLFINAGMNPFKDYFLGNQPIKDPRIANSQKCLRVSGKHNDLEEVGVDTYHHTLFEMLGNWSFGDYFKTEAIQWAWELLTEVYGLNPEDLYVTVFEGDEKDKVPKDQESIEIWSKLIDPKRIILASKKDNFWEMGDTGPCGPCSEIHVDLRSAEEKSKVSGKDLVNQDHPQVIEIWNLVFMQFNRKANGSLEALPQTHVDTGMGLERLAMALQKKTSNYDIDLFQALIQKMVDLSKVPYGVKENHDIAHRVIADHIRAIAFSIADGQLPSNQGAGYVIRRILRRAVRYGYQTLELKEPFLYALVSTLAEQMGQSYNELITQKNLIEKVIKEEEIGFFRTLEQGIKRMDVLIDAARKKGQNSITGTDIFELYDTYGFPLDLISLMAREQGLSIDEAGFKEELEKQKARSRAATGFESDDWQQIHPEETTIFVGYDQLEASVKLIKFRKVSQNQKSYFQCVFDQTPFYAEGGGQVGDSGSFSSNGETINIFDTKKENNLIVHLTDKIPSEPHQTFQAKVNEKRRLNIVRNHSTTHLLHHALRSVLGKHVEQKGSLVGPDYLRFDFSHFSKVTDAEMKSVLNIMEGMITNKIKLQEFRNTPIQQAKEMGAMALFGEKYGDDVRVIQFGASVELCGGTHVENTGDIGLIRLQSEAAVAAGIRRIEMVTGQKAEMQYKEESEILAELRQILKSPKDLRLAVKDLLEQQNKLTKTLESYIKERNINIKNTWLSKFENINGIQILCQEVETDAASVKDILFQIKGQIDSFIGIIGNIDADKCGLSIIISEDLVQSKGFNASNWIREVSSLIQGGGGGQPFFATAGGKHAAGLREALETLKRKI